MSRIINQSESKNLGVGLKNPLVIFGMILLAGDGPLVVAYTLTKNEQRAWVLLIATILFIFGMGVFFCYLVAFKPRHLYSPDQIPERAINRNLYSDPKPIPENNLLEEAQELLYDLNNSKDEKQKESITNHLNNQLKTASYIQNAYDLLFIPGYDISLISEILNFIKEKKAIDPINISEPRNITFSTVNQIINSMISNQYVENYNGILEVTSKGSELLKGLKTHFENQKEKN